MWPGFRSGSDSPECRKSKAGTDGSRLHRLAKDNSGSGLVKPRVSDGRPTCAASETKIEASKRAKPQAEGAEPVQWRPRSEALLPGLRKSKAGDGSPGCAKLCKGSNGPADTMSAINVARPRRAKLREREDGPAMVASSAGEESSVQAMPQAGDAKSGQATLLGDRVRPG